MTSLKPFFKLSAFAILLAVSCSKADSDQDYPIEFMDLVSQSEIDETFDQLSSFIGFDSSDKVSSCQSLINELRDTHKLEAEAIDLDARAQASEELEPESTHIAYTTITYTSVGPDGMPIELSGKIYVPCYTSRRLMPVSDVLINLFGTIPQGNSKMCEMAPVMYSFKHFATKGLAVFEPEYIGFGVSKDHLQTYLCQRLIAENCADMLVEGIKVIQEKYGVEFEDGFGTLITGYSQGGGNALALTRYLTVEASDEVKSLVNLKKTFCGAGPYDPFETFQTWVDNDGMHLSVILPMVFFGMNEAHSDIFAGEVLEDYFCQEYWDSGIPTLVQERKGGLTECVQYDENHAKEGGSRCLLGPEISPTVVASEEVLTKGTTKYNKLSQALKSEQVCYDWTPATPITVFCDSNDDIVPSVNTTLAYDALYEKAPDLVDIIESDTGSHILGMIIYNHLVGSDFLK